MSLVGLQLDCLDLNQRFVRRLCDLHVPHRVTRHPEALSEANLSSLKEIEKPAGIKNPARLKAFRAAILPTGSVMPSRYGIACCAASSISAATSLGCDS